MKLRPSKNVSRRKIKLSGQIWTTQRDGKTGAAKKKKK